MLLRDLVTANQVRTADLTEAPIEWGESLAVSGLFVALMLGLACWCFGRSDY